MADNTNSSVVNYLKNGKSKKPVTQRDIHSYFNNFVLNSPNLPMHYRSKLDMLLRDGLRTKNKTSMLKYLASELNCVVFLLESDQVTLRGISNILHHPKADLILDWLEDPKSVQGFFDENFSLYPIFIDTNITIGKKDIYDIALISTEINQDRIGFVGGMDIDYDLAVGILDYLLVNK